MFSRPLKSVVVVALIAATPGCTAAVWRLACEDRAVQPQIARIVGNYSKSGDRALVVRSKAIGDGTEFSPVPGAPPARSDADSVHPDTVCLPAYRLDAAGEIVPAITKIPIVIDEPTTRPSPE